MKGLPRSTKDIRDAIGMNETLNIAGSVPAAQAATVVAAEFGDDAVRRTRLTLTNMPVEVVSVTTGNGVGGTQIYDFPLGRILHLGTVGNLALSIATANQADFTDGTPEGDIGIGTVAPANADALGTDATDDNFGTATAFTGTAFADTDIDVPNEAVATFDGSGTAIDLFLNVLVDAADIDDGVTSEVLISGTIDIVWTLLGDY